jgi:hypothetical protein
MIPYDDLVIALATWRARQGLPVAQLSGSLTPPPPAPAPVARTAPPAPPRSGTPPPLAEVDEVEEEAALIEEAHYDNDGADFAMAFGGAVEKDAESTAIGVPPPTGGRDSFGGGGTLPDEGPRGGRKNDW